MSIKIKQLPISERPYEKLELYGEKALSNAELLAIIIKSGTKEESSVQLAKKILSLNNNTMETDDLNFLRDLSIEELMQIKGIGKVKAIELLAITELGKRIYMSINETDMINCTNPNNIIHYFNSLFLDKRQEEFYVWYLDNKKKFLDKKRLFIGSVNTSIAHPREIFKHAYLLSASYIICIHNHPSGDPTPSKEDIKITENIYQLGNLHAIYLIDHLIIGKNNYYSFYENNHILNNK